MKASILIFALTAALVSFVGSPAFAQDEKATTSTDAVKALTTPQKKADRKKKVAMCSECGKPETECECHDKKKEGDTSQDKKKTE